MKNKTPPEPVKPTRINWKDMNQDILDAVDSLESKGFKVPTIRSVYYVLGSLGKIPLTDQGYKALDEKIVHMRKDGEIPWGFFAVKRGTSIETDSYTSPVTTVKQAINYVRNIHDYYTIPRWYGQPNYVEVWIEKDGLLGALGEWTKDLGITVRAPQGYGAWEFINENIDKIKDELVDRENAYADDDVQVHILYLGDLDPSGKDIPRFLNDESFSHFGFDVEFTELALTSAQVSQFGLPEIPSSFKVQEKIEHDPRYRNYVAQYGNVFCELDAFFSLATSEAKELIRSSVEALYDPSFEEDRDNSEAEAKEEIRKTVKKAITFNEDKLGKRKK
jgi:hypothetical protein